MSENRALVQQGTAILSLRDSDFDSNSAYGEVLDNSIQANAENIDIVFDTQKKGRRHLITSVTFVDDGDGMDIDVLWSCLQLGYSSRYNDRTGIGRFGVGMTLAGINQCKKVEVYSKTENCDWHYTYIDLDKMCGPSPILESIPKPIKKNPPKEAKKAAALTNGTVVIWSKYDRQAGSALNIIDSFRIWLGRTFRHFIWDGINITLDGSVVPAIDPLYHTTEKTNFPDDPPSELFDQITIEWPVVDLDDQESDDENSEINILFSLLPESLRPHQGVGNAKSTTDRHIDMNQGVSIVRNKREVFYGPIPFWKGPSTWFGEKDRWWGCEIQFEAVLDRAFTVKNIKRGAVPIKELKDLIHDKIKGSRETCIREVTRVWEEAKLEKERKDQENKNPHKRSEQIAGKVKGAKPQIDKKKNKKQEIDDLVERLLKNYDAADKADAIGKWASQPFSIEESTWRGATFLDVNHLGGSDVLFYNMQHPFFEVVYGLLNQLKSDDPDNNTAHMLKTLLDLALISYSRAESTFDADAEIKAEDLFVQLVESWGRYLSQYVKAWEKDRGESDD